MAMTASITNLDLLSNSTGMARAGAVAIAGTGTGTGTGNGFGTGASSKASGKAQRTIAYVGLPLLLLLLLTRATCTLCTPISPCDSNSWWDPFKDGCVPCTICQGEMIPLRPCQLHRDTICGSIYDLKIDWVVLAKTEPNWKERRKSNHNYNNNHHNNNNNNNNNNHNNHNFASDQQQLAALQLSHLTPEQLQQLHDEAMPLDWQTSALIIAVLACLIFFIIAASILIHHMRQWRRMERRLDQDVEELSTKLMAKLAEVQTLEGGTFFIGNADALCLPTTATIFQPQHQHQHQRQHQQQQKQQQKLQQKLQQHQQNQRHVLLPSIKSEKSLKHPERRIIKAIRPGNVYIEEISIKP